MESALVRLGVTESDLESFCQRWGILRLELFGSALRDDFDERSDVDLLATFEPSHRPDLDALLAMEEELVALFGRHVDLV